MSACVIYDSVFHSGFSFLKLCGENLRFPIPRGNSLTKYVCMQYKQVYQNQIPAGQKFLIELLLQFVVGGGSRSTKLSQHIFEKKKIAESRRYLLYTTTITKAFLIVVSRFFNLHTAIEKSGIIAALKVHTQKVQFGGKVSVCLYVHYFSFASDPLL